MPGKSTRTTVVTLRLPNDVVEKVKRRLSGTGYPETVNSYLRKRIIYDINRKHARSSKASRAR